MAKASLDLIRLEEYKTTGELKAPQEFQKLLIPSIIRRLTPEEEKTPQRRGVSFNDELKKLGLPPLESTNLPPLPTLPRLP